MINEELEVRGIIIGFFGELESQYLYRLDSRRKAIEHFTECLNRGKDEDGNKYSDSDIKDIKGIIDEDVELFRTYKYRLNDIYKVLSYFLENRE